jgi:hypothetical protein
LNFFFFFNIIFIDFFEYICIEHIFNWILPIAIIGIAFETVAIVFENYSRPEIPTFAFFITIWNIFTIEKWRRKQFKYALKWNTLYSDDDKYLQDHARYPYTGQLIRSFVDGNEMIFFPASHRHILYIISIFFLILCIGLTLLALAAIYYYARYELLQLTILQQGVHSTDDNNNNNNNSYQYLHQWIISAGTVIQLMVCNRWYYFIAYMTTEWENHRLDQEFVVSLSSKFI